MAYLLTIAIPTYNGGEYLRQNLDILVPQILKHRDTVQLLVSNNASTDNTAEVIKDIQQKYAFQFDVYNHDKLIDGKEHFNWCLGKVEGKYFLLSGDDDIFSPDLIEILLRILSNGKEYGTVHWNVLNGDENCDNIQVIDSHQDGIYQELTPESMIQRVLGNMSFMSSVVFRHEYLKLYGDIDVSRCYGYEWLAQNIYGMLKVNLPCVYYFMPLAIQRNPHKEWICWWPLYHIVGFTNICKIIQDKIPGSKMYTDRLIKTKHSFADCLVLASVYRNIYRKRLDEIKEHLSSSLVIWMYFWQYVPCPRIWRFFYHKYMAVKRLLN